MPGLVLDTRFIAGSPHGVCILEDKRQENIVYILSCGALEDK